MKKYILLAVVVVFSLNLIAGCASIPKVGTEKVIERGPGPKVKKAPDWIYTTYVEQKGYLYFTGMKLGVQRRDIGLRQAEGEAKKRVTEGINQKVTTEFTDSVQGSNVNVDDLGDFTRDAVGVIGNLPSLQGLQVEEQYWERVERVIGVKEVELIHNCYALMRLSVADYKKARDIALNGLAQKAKEAKDERAEEIAETLMKKLAAE